MTKPARPMDERFWECVQKGEANECWLWTGERMLHPYTKAPTYGRFFIKTGQHTGAHRVSWLIHHGELPPKGICVCHSCDNPPCVNPAHLFLGTHNDNMRDKVQKGRANGGANKGEINPEHILKTEQVKEIIQLLKQKVPRKVLAAQYGVAYPTISCIAQGRTWKHIPRD